MWPRRREDYRRARALVPPDHAGDATSLEYAKGGELSGLRGLLDCRDANLFELRTNQQRGCEVLSVLRDPDGDPPC